MFSFLLLNFLVIGLWCNEIERMFVPEDQPFSFDCRSDESVYFGETVNNWSEIHDGDLNLSFQYLTEENLLRVKSNSAQKKNVGYYGCRKPTWTSTDMNTIYQLILADVDLFYWNFVCYGPGDSCTRTDDQLDESLSTLEVTERIDIEIFCCVSSNGFKNVNLRLNAVGENTRAVEMQRKEELDGSSVICAQQRTKFIRRLYQKQQTLKCELFVNNQPYSTLSSVIVIKDGIIPNRYDNSMWNYQRTPEQTDSQSFFPPQNNIVQPRRVMNKRKKVAIIVGSTVGGVIFLVLLLGMTYLLCCQKKTKKSTKTRVILEKSYPTKPIRPLQRRYENDRFLPEAEHHYEEPVALSETSPVFIRC